MLLIDSGLNAHPERDSSDNLEDDTAKTPNINDPRILVAFHLL
jgi:hypothetical protein